MRSRFIPIIIAAATLALGTPAMAERGKDHRGDRYHHTDRAFCPPGLAKKNRDCLPPGKAKKAEDHRPLKDWPFKADPKKAKKNDKHHARKHDKKKRYQRGEWIRRDAVRIDPRRYQLPREHSYWRVDDFIYRVDPRTGKVLEVARRLDR